MDNTTHYSTTANYSGIKKTGTVTYNTDNHMFTLPKLSRKRCKKCKDGDKYNRIDCGFTKCNIVKERTLNADKECFLTTAYEELQRYVKEV